MTNYIAKISGWLDTHGLLAQVQHGCKINDLEADIERLQHENETLRKENIRLSREPGTRSA
ncbi:MAG: hypothetical protein ACR2PO_10150 [Methyloligellaceae bacterium]